MNTNETGQSTPKKTSQQKERCNQVVAGFRAVLANANAKRAEHKRINKPLVTHHLAINKVRNAGGAKQVWQEMNNRHQDTVYQALAYSMPMQSQLRAGI